MAAHDDDLVGQLASADLSDQVEGVGVGKEPGLHAQPQADPGAAVLHPLKAVGVLRRHRGGRDMGLVVCVPKGSGVGGPQARWADGPYQSGDRAFGGGP